MVDDGTPCTVLAAAVVTKKHKRVEDTIMLWMVSNGLLSSISQLILSP